MKKQEKCLPLTLLQSISNKYPGCWNSIEEVRKNMNWPTWCYIPMTYCRRIVMMAMHKKGENPNDAKAIVAGVLDGDLMGALASWRGSHEPADKILLARYGRESDLIWLLNNPDWRVRAEVAKRGIDGDLDWLRSDWDWRVRCIVAEFGRPQDLALLQNDTDDRVRATVAACQKS